MVNYCNNTANLGLCLHFMLIILYVQYSHLILNFKKIISLEILMNMKILKCQLRNALKQNSKTQDIACKDRCSSQTICYKA